MIHDIVNASQSLNRILVDDALQRRGTSFDKFVAAGRDQGKTYDEIATEISTVTGVPFAVRTFYRWLEKERAS